MEIYPGDVMVEDSWLFVFADLDGKKHFFELNIDIGQARFDKFFNNEAAFKE